MQKIYSDSMDSKFFINNQNEILVTTRIDYWKHRIGLGTFPEQNYRELQLKDITSLKDIDTVAFDKIGSTELDACLNLFRDVSINKTIAIHECRAEHISAFVCDHLIIGDKNTLPFSAENLKLVTKISFLSLKTLNGIFDSPILNVEELIIWNDKSKVNEIISFFPNLQKLRVYSSSFEILDLEQHAYVSEVEIYNCKRFREIKSGFLNKIEVYIESFSGL